ncbi:hypothetical protein M8C21_011544 [Ambrosia artemisiifolia]|uniref:NAD(P)-binding domain-containing protein n=1 Tax=Ambrosia artemisiifolia TaxID=4212 RepID=A0AAD5GBD4_AMBAR|nr:hypothetical protein M8C21_011544 [Ambrosia artemisiifolia]
MSEDIIQDFHRNSDMAVMILRYFNVIGSDPDGRLGEAPRPELREHGRISGACFDAARGITKGLKEKVNFLFDINGVKLRRLGQPVRSDGLGRSVKEFVEACKKATGASIKVEYLPRRPGDYAEVFSDPSKIRRELKWSARFTDLEKSLRVAWEWQKSHHNGYEPTKASF